MKDDATKVKEEKLIEMVSSFCEDKLDDEYKRLSVELVQKLGRKYDVPFKRGKLENWASGVIYALGQINFLFDKSFEPHATPDDICGYFGTKKSTAANKARDIRKLLNLDSFSNTEFVTNRVSDSIPKFVVDPSTGLIIPQDMFEDLNSGNSFKDIDFDEDEFDIEYINDMYCFDGKEPESTDIEIDMFKVIVDLNDGDSFDEAYDDIQYYSKNSKKEIFDALVENSYIKLNSRGFKITDKGYEFVINNEWMFLYKNFLSDFSFDDFKQFYKKSSLSVEDSAIKFLKKHVKLANEKENFSQLVDSYSALSMIYDHIGKYIPSLKYELKVFILNLNPVYLDKDDLELHDAVEFGNAFTLSMFNKAFSTSKMKQLFNKEWKNMDYKKEYIPKNVAEKTLTRILNNEDLFNLSEELEKKYFP